MEKFSNYFFLFIVVVILLNYLKNKKKDISLVKSSLDGDSYLVRYLPDNKQAANRLAFIRSKLTEVVELLKPETNSAKTLYNKYIKTVCDHYFHKKCFEDWLKVKLECPLCKSKFDDKIDIVIN